MPKQIRSKERPTHGRARSGVRMLAAIVASGLALSVGRAQTYVWDRYLTDIPYSNPAIATYAGDIYAFGGFQDNPRATNVDAIFRCSSLEGGTWDLLDAHLPYGTFPLSNTPIVSQGKFLMAPSYGPTGAPSGWGQHNRIIEYDFATEVAAEAGTYTDYSRIWGPLLAEATTGDVYSFGGWTGSGVTNIYRYDPVTQVLTDTGADLSVGNRPGAAATGPNGEIAIFGIGLSPRRVDVFDPADTTTNAAVTLGDIMPAAFDSSWANLAWNAGGKTYVTSLGSTNTAGTVFEYDWAAHTFQAAPFTLPPETAGFERNGVGWYDDASGRLYVTESKWTGTQWETAVSVGAPEVQPPQRVYGVCVGSQQMLGPVAIVRGGEDAESIADMLDAFASCGGTTRVVFDFYAYGDASKPTVFQTLSLYESKLKAGDTMVFFFSGHGSGGIGDDEAIWLNETGINAYITDDELTAWFLSESTTTDGRRRKDVWEDVNKLFILDSCHSGGFAMSVDPLGIESDLDLLKKAALLAACEEDANIGTNADGSGILTAAVVQALLMVDGHAAADVDRDGLSFDELASFCSDFFASMTEYDGYIKGDLPDGDTELRTFAPPFLVGWQSDDFDMQIPEPATLSLLALGALAVIRRGRRQMILPNSPS